MHLWLSLPWGEAKDDQDQGGYHLVWTRDMVSSVAGLVAAGETDTAVRSLIYLATSQQEDGGFPQNFWVDGKPYWTGIQLDEVAFPILLAWLLHQQKTCLNFMIISNSPSTLAFSGLKAANGKDAIIRLEFRNS